MKKVGAALSVFLMGFGGAAAGYWVMNRFDPQPATLEQAIPDVLQDAGRDDVAAVQRATFNLDQLPSGTFDFRTPSRAIMDAVVSIDRIQAVRRNLFDDSTTLRPTGSGSGVIISKDGLIVTNHHVIQGAQSINVRLKDGRVLQAQVVGTDQRSDIALLRVTANNLRPAKIGTSKDLEVGEWVLAVGNPLGYSHTVSVGVVSSLGRTLAADRFSLLVDAIQTDAAINQGNSGGALANSRGELIGINTAIASTTGGSIGIGFAIPIDRVQRVVRDLQRDGRVRYGSLGELIYAVTLDSDPVRQELSMLTRAKPPTRGVILRGVVPGSPLANLGLERFDVITSIDGRDVSNPMDLEIALADKRAGDRIKLSYWKRGETRTVEVTLAELGGFGRGAEFLPENIF
jgi:S1-C subfamily serine protease